jgi:hypothetical protein
MKWNFNNLSLADLPKARCEKPSICPVYFPDFSYRNRNTSLPGNMLPDAELYVKNKVSRTKDGHAPLPLFLLSSMCTERKIRIKIRKDQETFNAPFSKGGAFLRFRQSSIFCTSQGSVMNASTFIP